jgi:hypothetical protein
MEPTHDAGNRQRRHQRRLERSTSPKLLRGPEDRANGRAFGYVLVDLEARPPVGRQIPEKFEVRPGDGLARLIGWV